MRLTVYLTRLSGDLTLSGDGIKDNEVDRDVGSGKMT